MIVQDIFQPNQMGEPLDNAQMDALDELAKTDPTLPISLSNDPSWYEGFGSASWRGFRSGILKSESAMLGAAGAVAPGMAATENEARDTLSELEEIYGVSLGSGQIAKKAPGIQKAFESALDAKSKSLRQEAAKNFGVDPATMGFAAQVVYGLAESLPQMIGYTIASGGNVGAGALLYGTDMGIRRTQELKDKGVDDETATNAGLVTFVSSALGARLPAAFGPSRAISAAAGAGVNVGTTAAEMAAISGILSAQNYGDLAKQYQLTFPEASISGAFGATMGALFFRSKVNIARAADRAAKISSAEEGIYSGLMNNSGNTYIGKNKLVWAEAHQKALSAVNLADAAGVDVESILPKIEWNEKGEISNKEKVLAMPETQGIHWEMGPSKGLTPETEVNVVPVRLTKNTLKADELKRVISNEFGPDGIKNNSTGWRLSASKTDIGKWLQVHGAINHQKVFLISQIKGHLSELLSDATLTESHVDSKGNSNVKGIHHFVTAVDFDGKTYRVHWTVRDYKQKGLSTHHVDGCRVERTHPPVANDSSAGDGLRVESRGKVRNLDTITIPIIHPLKITLSDLLGGRIKYKRGDGRGFFDPVDPASREKGGVYCDETLAENKKVADKGGELAQTGKGGEKVRGLFSPEGNRLVLTKNANLSTFSHEWGHWYLSNMFTLFRDGRVSPEMSADVKAVLKSFGLDSMEEWDSLGFEGQRNLQEQFARQFEQYLSTGKAPSTGLRYVFETIASVIRDAYDTVKSSISEEYKAQTGEDLPPMSEEVKGVFDRMFREQDRVTVNGEQSAAARLLQAENAAAKKRTAIASDSGDSVTPENAAADIAQRKAEQSADKSLQIGKAVDVSAQAADMGTDGAKVDSLSGDFARSYMNEDTGNIVVLQNRDRSRVSSVAQMNSIASNPQYGLMSFDRGTSSGAPIVSFGEMPPEARLGRRDVVTDPQGVKTPVWYAVVEADSVLTSNAIDGTSNAAYGDPTKTNAVAGNGRATGLAEAYRRGNADQYRAELESDPIHGVDPQVIKGMKHPMLVRIISPSDVTTGFVHRSNIDQVMSRSDVEVARADAPKIRQNIRRYEFDDNGRPTSDTVRQFVTDIGEVNALGKLLNAWGEPTPEAVRRIRQAVFFEAYRDPVLSSLFSEDLDSGVVRVLNGLVSVAPQIIELREASDGRLDLSRPIVEAANMIYTAKKNPREGADFTSQGSLLDSSAAGPFAELLDSNSASAAGIKRILGPTIDWAKSSLSAEDGGLFGAEQSVHTDVPDVIAQMRKIENAQRIAEGKEPLPGVDLPALRESWSKTMEQVKEDAGAVERLQEKVAEARQERADAGLPEDQLESGDSTGSLFPGKDIEQSRAEARGFLESDSADDVRVSQAIRENPGLMIEVPDENGNMVSMSAAEALERADADIRQADVDSSAMGAAVACVLNNRGI